MDHLLEVYASSSSDEDDDEAEKKNPAASSLGELPPELRSIFKDSEYDLANERRRAAERAGNTQWVRRFPHERGNWPTHVFIPVPNTAPFRSMAEASVAHFRRRLADAWRERHGCESGGKRGGERGRKRARDGARRRWNQPGGDSTGMNNEPPEVVMNDMSPSGQQHLSLSKTTALRAHQIEPFVHGLREAVRTSRSFSASVVSGYDILVNEDKTRSFVCLKVRGGRQVVINLIAKVDPLMRRFMRPEYYEDPVVHVSVASVLGDMSTYVSSSSAEAPGNPAAVAVNGVLKAADGGEGKQGAQDGGRSRGGDSDAGGNDDGESSSDEGHDVPSEICLPISVVVCKVGTNYFEAPLLAA